jgi:hypothetical protein
MGILKRNKAFLLTAVLILVAGTVLFGGVVAVRVLADTSGAAQPAAVATPATYNTVSSFGMTGYAPLKLVPTDQTPDFIKARLDEQRGIVLLVYIDGAADDMEMLQSFNAAKAQYAADSSFLDFEARKSSDLGDTLQQLRVSNPPILAVIRGNGDVAQLYTGWISQKVMSQVIANAARGL